MCACVRSPCNPVAIASSLRIPFASFCNEADAALPVGPASLWQPGSVWWQPSRKPTLPLQGSFQGRVRRAAAGLFSTPEDLFQILQSAPGVVKVTWNTSKTSQGNKGNQYCVRNMLVLSKLGMGPGSASSTIEFELTRNQHTPGTKVLFRH